jgi:hypothetical protein
MALRTHSLPSGRLKKTCFFRWSDISRCRWAMRTHFLHPGHRKKRLGRSRLSDVLSRLMDLRFHNLPSVRFKMRLFWCRWSDVSWFRKAIRSIFNILCIQKSDLNEVVELMFNLANGPGNSWSAFWASQKPTFVNSIKRCFKLSKVHANSFSEPVHRKNEMDEFSYVLF